MVPSSVLRSQVQYLGRYSTFRTPQNGLSERKEANNLAAGIELPPQSGAQAQLRYCTPYLQELNLRAFEEAPRPTHSARICPGCQPRHSRRNPASNATAVLSQTRAPMPSSFPPPCQVSDGRSSTVSCQTNSPPTTRAETCPVGRATLMRTYSPSSSSDPAGALGA